MINELAGTNLTYKFTVKYTRIEAKERVMLVTGQIKGQAESRGGCPGDLGDACLVLDTVQSDGMACYAGRVSADINSPTGIFTSARQWFRISEGFLPELKTE